MIKIATGYDKAPWLVYTIDVLTAAPVASQVARAFIAPNKIHSTKFLGIPSLGPSTSYSLVQGLLTQQSFQVLGLFRRINDAVSYR